MTFYINFFLLFLMIYWASNLRIISDFINRGMNHVIFFKYPESTITLKVMGFCHQNGKVWSIYILDKVHNFLNISMEPHLEFILLFCLKKLNLDAESIWKKVQPTH